MLARSRIDARDWLDLAWRMVATPAGVSAGSVRKELGLSFDSTFYLMHKLRRAMGEANQASYPMGGTVEVDEAFLGGPKPGVRGRGALGREILLIIVGHKGQSGKVYIERVPDAKATTLLPIIQSHVRPGAHILTDGHRGYQGLAKAGYRHTAYPVARMKIDAHTVLPSVHSVASRFKRTWLDTWGGGIAPSQMQWYLEEFSFKYNRRHYKYPGRIFYELMVAAMAEPYRTAASLRGGL